MNKEELLQELKNLKAGKWTDKSADAIATVIDEYFDDHIFVRRSRKARRAKFTKELKQKIDSYERELSKSGDSTKCDDVDWVTLASDMFDMLQKCLLNF